MDRNVIKGLEDIINSSLEDIALPYVNGNSIRIKHMIVRKSKAGWLVYNSQTSKQVARLFCKASAIALAKSYSEGKSRKIIITDLDRIIEKNYQDCVFYKHTLDNCDDDFKREVTYNRYEICMSKTQKAKKSLDQFIFGR